MLLHKPHAPTVDYHYRLVTFPNMRVAQARVLHTNLNPTAVCLGLLCSPTFKTALCSHKIKVSISGTFKGFQFCGEQVRE